MTNGRNVASITAVIACALAAPLAIGSYSAQADELSDLRVNQQLLQQRLDQLAQIPSPTGVYPGGPPSPTAGAGIVGGSFPRSFLVPGTDTSIRVGGNIWMDVVYQINGGNPGTVQNNNAGSTGFLNTIPLSNSGAARARSDNTLFMTPRRTNVNFETRRCVIGDSIGERT